VKLVAFTQGGVTRVGAVADAAVVDLGAAAPELPRDMIAFLERGAAALAAARDAVVRSGARIALAELKLEAPVRRPPKVLAIGLNYADHIAESKAKNGLGRPAHRRAERRGGGECSSMDVRRS
jgi:2-keto-4-pentenoate hydratase/2-oxohepta-3-ene-1,7-dioic acid hydratase in catechol pathway